MPLETSYKANATPSQTLLRKLEELEEESSRHSSLSGSSRWMIPYADMLTLLLGFFMVMYASLQMDHQTLKTYTQNVQKSLSSSFTPGNLTSNDTKASSPLLSPPQQSSQAHTIQKQQEDLEALMSEIKSLEKETQQKASSSSIPFTVEADGLNYLQAELQAEFDAKIKAVVDAQVNAQIGFNNKINETSKFGIYLRIRT
ncbi:MAG: hypothetical protein K2X66_02320, partial [Cyanobacteria bacterium]|nr:hypothetical protein [Cyanobacteriota bacterium]